MRTSRTIAGLASLAKAVASRRARIIEGKAEVLKIEKFGPVMLITMSDGIKFLTSNEHTQKYQEAQDAEQPAPYRVDKCYKHKGYYLGVHPGTD